MTEWVEAADIVYQQTQETVEQELADITVRLATVTCPCGRKRALVKMYKCLYCKVWFCTQCAEDHFGKTVEQWKANLRR